jgi:glycosyltransferase involved in cell wall biosynthesis
MKICLLGLDNLHVLAPEYAQHTVGGESVQQTLLARALSGRGHEVSMVVFDYGQRDGAQWESIRAFKAYALDAGLPALRFIHPRWTGLWSALARADADLYYTSCAGMHVGLLALFCRRARRRFVFRTASDSDCDPSRLLVRFARDRWLYQYGLRRADAVLTQSAFQARALERHYALHGRTAAMLVESPRAAAFRDVDVLWTSNVRRVKRPDRILELAGRLPDVTIHMVGGSQPGEEALFASVSEAAAARPNVMFHGPLSYRDANGMYDRAKVFVNTSDVEGFPNSYLQAWIRGVPVVTLFDPDGVVEREGLGVVVKSPARMAEAIGHLLGDTAAWTAASDRCRAFMAGEFEEEKVLAPYLAAFEQVMGERGIASGIMAREGAHHA